MRACSATAVPRRSAGRWWDSRSSDRRGSPLRTASGPLMSADLATGVPGWREPGPCPRWSAGQVAPDHGEVTADGAADAAVDVLPYGDRALLVEVPDLATVTAVRVALER